MVSILKLNSPKIAVENLLEISSFAPKTAIALARRGVSFSNLEDWIRVAEQALIFSPHAIFWRRLALKYPEPLVLRDLSLFLQTIKTHPALSEQIRALLFTIPAKKLPKASVLNQLSRETEEQLRVRKLLLRKKKIGDAAFYVDYFLENINKKNDGMVSFLLESGEVIQREEKRFMFDEWHIKQNRVKSAYGPSTLITVDKGGAEGIRFYLLPDGAPGVKKLNFSSYKSINLSHA